MQDQQPTSILDIRGLVIESYFSDSDIMGLKHPEDPEKLINRAEFGVPIFINKYLQPCIDLVGAPRYIIAVADGGNDFRKNILPEYKAKRGADQHPLVKEQIQSCYRMCIEVIKALGTPIVYLDRQEADDVIAYLCGTLQGHKIIHTVDRDLLALCSEEVSVFRGGAIEDVFRDKKEDIPVPLITVYKSMVGDASDGYKGIDRVGPAAYKSMLQEFGEDGMLQLSSLLDKRDRVTLNKVAQNTENKAFHKCYADVINWFNQFTVAKLHPELCNPDNLTWTQRPPMPDALEHALVTAECPDFYEDLKKWTYEKTLVVEDNLEDVVKKS